jgi:hypothetical protein
MPTWALLSVISANSAVTVITSATVIHFVQGKSWGCPVHAMKRVGSIFRWKLLV